MKINNKTEYLPTLQSLIKQQHINKLCANSHYTSHFGTVSNKQLACSIHENTKCYIHTEMSEPQIVFVVSYRSLVVQNAVLLKETGALAAGLELNVTVELSSTGFTFRAAQLILYLPEDLLMV